MKPIIIDMKDLSESTELYEASPNPFAGIFVYVMLAFTLLTLIWMSLFKIDDVVNCDGRLVKNADGSYRLELLVPDPDYGKIREGQEVRFEIAAYPANEFSYYYGEVEAISDEPFSLSEKASSFYLSDVAVSLKDLKAPDGKQLALADGLSCRAGIVIGRETVLKYLLKRL